MAERKKSYVHYTPEDWAATINPTTAFDRSYHDGSRGRGSDNPLKTVKNHYEGKLKGYLSKLAPDPDFAAIPDKYQPAISSFLVAQKQKYVNAANSVDEYEVGSKTYMKKVAEMNQISNSFKQLQAQFKKYGDDKTSIIESIESGTTSMYGENQKNVNFLRGVYNEEYEIQINEDGNLAFMGEEGAINMSDMPGYEPKDFTMGKNMMDMGVNVYKSGKKLKQGGIMYNQYSNQLRMQLDEGGEARIMSVLHDGLVGDKPFIEDPIIKGVYDQYQAGEVGLEDLRNSIVDNYMKVLVKQSEYGVQVNGSGSGSGGTAASRKANKKMDLLSANYKNIKPGGDLKSINRFLPSNIRLIETDDGEFIVQKSAGSRWDDEITLDINDPNSIYDLYRQAGIDSSYWPDVDNENEDVIEEDEFQ